MSNELCVDNLHRIISKSGDNVETGFQNRAELFLRKIADDTFLILPAYSKGFNIKTILWNYLNLNDGVRSRFEDQIISKWKSFQRTRKETAYGLTNPPNDNEKVSSRSDSCPEINQPETARKDIKFREETRGVVSTFVPTNVEAPLAPAERKTESTPSVPKKNVPQEPVLMPRPLETNAENLTKRRPVIKKVATSMSGAKVPAKPKSRAAISSIQVPGDKRKRKARPKTLKMDVQDLTKDMKSLEDKIEKMIKRLDRIAESELAGSKALPKRTSPSSGREKVMDLTDTDKVVKIIMRRKKNGIDVPTLSQRTGFNAQKIRNIVSRELKNGKIKRVGRGLYCSK